MRRCWFALLLGLAACAELPVPAAPLVVSPDAAAPDLASESARGVDGLAGLDLGGGRLLDVHVEGQQTRVRVGFGSASAWVPVRTLDGAPRVFDAGVLELLAHLESLEGAGARVARTGDGWLVDAEGRPTRCRWDYATAGDERVRCERAPALPPEPRTSARAPLDDATLRHLLRPATLPPGMRLARAREPGPPRSRAAAVRAPVGPFEPFDSPLAAVADPGVTLSGFDLGHGTRGLLVAHRIDGELDNELLCIGDDAHLDCTSSYIMNVEGLVAAPSESVWLLRTESSGGRATIRPQLTLVRREHDGRIVMDQLALGRQGGYGEACEDYDGYCVWVDGEWVEASLVAPGCIEVRPGGTWSILHVRMGDRWVDEQIDPVDPSEACASRYRFDEGQLEPAACGPPTDLPACPEAERGAP